MDLSTGYMSTQTWREVAPPNPGRVPHNFAKFGKQLGDLCQKMQKTALIEFDEPTR